jgi:Co/Zn/Cd efflux system component
MSHSCCATGEAQIARRRRVLWLVLGINAVMFFVELGAGLFAGSVALQADSLDMLGDALVYGFSLAVVAGSLRSRARAAQLKGTIMLIFGLGVLVQVILKVLRGVPPDPVIVSGTGAAALLANLACVGLLFQHRAADINMRSTWVCSRNDILANLGVIVSAGAVGAFSSIWPDIIVSVGIVTLFLWSAAQVLQEAAVQLHPDRSAPTVDLCRNRLCPAHACQCAAA